MSLAAMARRLAVSDGRALVWLLFSPHGWTGRVNFLRGAAAIFIANSFLVAVTLGLWVKDIASPDLMAEAFFLASLATIYPTVCVAAKRLHGMGRSAWLQAPVRLLMSAGLGLMALYQRGEQTDLMGAATSITFVLGCLAEVAMFIWLAAAPNHPGAEAPREAVQA